MKKKGFISGILVFAVSIMLCGCEQAYELTDEEEAAIVHYSAHIVSKYNKKQPEGVNNVAPLEKLMAMESEQEQEAESEEDKQPEEETKADDASVDDAGADTQEQNSDAGGSEAAASYVSLNQALQLGGIDAVYRNYEITDTYGETESYVVSPNSGNKLLVVHINLKNNGNRAADCDLLSKLPVFQLIVNGDVYVMADTTILLNDLSTYQGSIEAGGTVETVLVFQLHEGDVKKVNSMDMEVTVGGNTSTVQLVSG